MPSTIRVVILIFLSIIFPFSLSFNQASFYGNSFISIPLKEAKGSTNIYFKFRTHLPNTLIFLVAGITDYCIIKLDNAKLKVNLNLGSGEFEVSSNSKLNDFKWHKVHLMRTEANLTLSVDNQNFVKHLPGKFFELNVHYGIFVGGHGNFSDLFFGHIDNFRGCLADVTYNGISVLDLARHRYHQNQHPYDLVVEGVSWNCATEFEANSNKPISFLQEKSFMVVSTSYANYSSNFLKLQLELKTVSNYSVLVYNQGSHLSKQDYFSLEIFKGKCKATFKSDRFTTELFHNEIVADGKWHNITLQLLPTYLDLKIDAISKKNRVDNVHINLHQLFYIGGIEASKRGRAMMKGLKKSDANFFGCMRHLKIGEKNFGLKDAIITEGLLPFCIWTSCFNSSSLSFSYNNSCSFTTQIEHLASATDLELVTVKNLHVLEEKAVLITSEVIHINLDYHRYGVPDSGVIFRVLKFPKHGIIKLNVWPHEKDSFTLHHLSKDQVYYVHDGSEYDIDEIVLEVKFISLENFVLPGHLRGNFPFSLLVNVQLTNDPPKLLIPSSTVLRVAQGKRRIIRKDFLKVIDPDTPPENLIFYVINSVPGYFELVDVSNTPVSSFTHKNVIDEKVTFVHREENLSENDSFISLQVGDGINKSEIVKLRVSTYLQNWWLKNNTGLILMYGISQMITPYNLSFASNDPDAIENVQYNILQAPQYGDIETDVNNSSWIKTDIFTSQNLRLNQVRYSHKHGSPKYDEFLFTTTLNSSSNYSFRITFIECSVKQKILQNSKMLLYLNKYEGVVNEEIINFETDPAVLPPDLIDFVLTSNPKYGYLASTNRLHLGDTFTQADIIMKKIKYRTFKESYSSFKDNFYFKVKAPGCTSNSGNVTIFYKVNPDKDITTAVLLEPVTVDEGGEVSIPSSKFRLNCNICKNLVFNVTECPRYGILKMNTSICHNGNLSFTLDQIETGALLYAHDDSETTSDSFTFIAISLEENFQYVDSNTVKIVLKNDNRPIRIINKVFDVVINGEKLLTGNDLQFNDPDLNSKPADIVYTCREITNGELMRIDSKNNITEFTQQDIDSELVLFKHKGSELGKINLWVTDGKFYVNDVLQIKASTPFIHVITPNKLIVKQGSRASLTEENLSYVTNLLTKDENVFYEILSSPVHGDIFFVNHTKTNRFSQAQINNKDVYYIHDGSKTNADELKLRVIVRDKNVAKIIQISIWILPKTYWEPIILKTIKELHVEESTSALIDKNILEVFQSDVPASALTYHVAEYGKSGYITALPNSNLNLLLEDKAIIQINQFTQASVNEKNIFYIQSGAKNNQTEDSVIFNVTNGIVWLNKVELKIIIIPENIYLESKAVLVREGSIAPISNLNIIVSNEYYKDKIIKYKVWQQPKFGCLIFKTVKVENCKITEFSQNLLLKGELNYQHDNSENLKDEIVITALAKNKQSIPISLKIDVLSVNDCYPRLVNNTGATIWEGSALTLNNNMLAALDDDRPMETLYYEIVRCWWGNISLISNFNTVLENFTQEHLNNQSVVFRHSNGSEAKFVFRISDGLHTSSEYTFKVKSKPVNLILIKSMSLHVFPLNKKVISYDHLLSSVPDNRLIDYQVIKSPSLGRLIIYDKSTNVFRVVNSFTQQDINSSRLFYEHTHPFHDLYANDSFIFNIKSHLAPCIFNKEFKIDISVSSGGLDVYFNIPNVAVDEGGVTNIKLNFSGIISFLENHSGLRSPVIHGILTAPKYGYVSLKDNSNSNSSSPMTFSQEQLESGLLCYQHDHSDSIFDKIPLTLYLIPGYVMLINVSIPIRINPINDQPFVLMTLAPHISVVQGEYAVITNKELLTEDKDTLPQDIWYDIISKPSEGKIVFLTDMKTTINCFTQKDVNLKKVVYKHYGIMLTDNFHIRVSDGKFYPKYTVFNVQVIPVFLNVTVGLPAFIQQGLNTVTLTDKLFFIETNADKKKINFLIKEPPKFGSLYLRDKQIEYFSYSDLETNNVIYMQINMSSAKDSFSVLAAISFGNVSLGNHVDVFIKVQPLIQIKEFTAYPGRKNRLTHRVLDATPLAKMTNRVPHFNITQSPIYGQIRKIIRTSGGKRDIFDIPVTCFTDKEVQSGLIYLVVPDIDIRRNRLEDKFEFILYVDGSFQRALGVLKIYIVSPLHAQSNVSDVPGPNDPEEHEGTIHLSSPNITRDYFLAVSMVVGVVVLGIAVIIIIKCTKLEAENGNKQEQLQQPLTLPRPPDRLMTCSTYSKQQNLEGFVSLLPSLTTTTTTPTTLPHCKVTPLTTATSSYDRMENININPYLTTVTTGPMEQIDDWSSCDASDPSGSTKSNIMLRRNQYWV